MIVEEKNIYRVGIRITNTTQQKMAFALFSGYINTLRNTSLTPNDVIPPQTLYDCLLGGQASFSGTFSGNTIILKDNPNYLQRRSIPVDFVLTNPTNNTFYIKNEEAEHIKIDKLSGDWDNLRSEAEQRKGIEIFEIIIRSQQTQNFDEFLLLYELSPFKNLGVIEIPVGIDFKPEQYQQHIINIKKHIEITPNNVLTFAILGNNVLEITLKVKLLTQK